MRPVRLGPSAWARATSSSAGDLIRSALTTSALEPADIFAGAPVPNRCRAGGLPDRGRASGFEATDLNFPPQCEGGQCVVGVEARRAWSGPLAHRARTAARRPPCR